MRTLHRVAGVLAIAVLAIAVPASAQVPPGMTAPTSPSPVGPGAGPAPGSGNAGADPVERQGPFVAVGLDAGPEAALVGDLQVGWMIAPWVGVFVSLSGLLVEESAAHLRGAGLRLASGVAFAEARILSVDVDRECYDGSCDEDPPAHRADRRRPRARPQPARLRRPPPPPAHRRTGNRPARRGRPGLLLLIGHG